MAKNSSKIYKNLRKKQYKIKSTRKTLVFYQKIEKKRLSSKYLQLPRTQKQGKKLCIINLKNQKVYRYKIHMKMVPARGQESSAQ